MNRALDRDRRSSSQVWLDVISAVDYLSQGHRPGLTVYDALEEALRWHAVWSIADHDELPFPVVSEPPWDDPDSLHTVLGRVVLDHPPALHEESTFGHVIHQALTVWATRMSEQHNAGRRWTHPRLGHGPRPLTKTENRTST